MKKLICVILVLGVCGCAQNGQGKGQKSGFPVQVTSQEQGGLPVEIMADEGKPLPVRATVTTESQLPVRLEPDPAKPVPVKMDVSDIPVSALVMGASLVGGLVLLSIFAFFVSILAWRTALDARRKSGKRDE